jgi:hypothetical protein
MPAYHFFLYFRDYNTLYPFPRPPPPAKKTLFVRWKEFYLLSFLQRMHSSKSMVTLNDASWIF